MTTAPQTPQPAPKEGFSWGKWAGGVFNPLNFAKSSAHVLQIILIILTVVLCIKAASWVKGLLFPRASQPVQIENVTGGHIETQPDKRAKFGLINF